MSASTIIRPIAEVIADLVNGLDVSANLTAHTWEPMKGQLEPPCILIEIPEIKQVGIEEQDYEMGSHAWVMTYMLAICFDLDKFPDCADDLVDVTEALLGAVNDDHTLGYTTNNIYAIQEAHITNVERPAQQVDVARPLLITECELELLALIS